MKPTIDKIRKLVNNMPVGACKAVFTEALAKCGPDGGVTTQDSGGGGHGDPPRPPE